MSLRLIHVLPMAALVLAACTSSPVPRRSAAVEATATRVVVAPLNLAVRTPAELEGRGEPVWRELLSYFQASDRPVAVLSAASAAHLWRDATRDLDVSRRGEALRTAQARVAQALARHRDYDLLVVPSLVLRPGKLQGRYAAWDGVHRLVPNGTQLLGAGLGDVTQPPGLLQVSGLRGTIAGVSLHVCVLRPDGTQVYEGLGGLDVLQEARRKTTWDGGWSFEPRAEPFSEPAHLREGVALAFGASF
jgi:hypothetical protein